MQTCDALRNLLYYFSTTPYSMYPYTYEENKHFTVKKLFDKLPRNNPILEKNISIFNMNLVGNSVSRSDGTIILCEAITDFYKKALDEDKDFSRVILILFLEMIGFNENNATEQYEGFLDEYIYVKRNKLVETHNISCATLELYDEMEDILVEEYSDCELYEDSIMNWIRILLIECFQIKLSVKSFHKLDLITQQLTDKIYKDYEYSYNVDKDLYNICYNNFNFPEYEKYEAFLDDVFFTKAIDNIKKIFIDNFFIIPDKANGGSIEEKLQNVKPEYLTYNLIDMFTPLVFVRTDTKYYNSPTHMLCLGGMPANIQIPVINNKYAAFLYSMFSNNYGTLYDFYIERLAKTDFSKNYEENIDKIFDKRLKIFVLAILCKSDSYLLNNLAADGTINRFMVNRIIKEHMSPDVIVTSYLSILISTIVSVVNYGYSLNLLYDTNNETSENGDGVDNVNEENNTADIIYYKEQIKSYLSKIDELNLIISNLNAENDSLKKSIEKINNEMDLLKKKDRDMKLLIYERDTLLKELNKDLSNENNNNNSNLNAYSDNDIIKVDDKYEDQSDNSISNSSVPENIIEEIKNKKILFVCQHDTLNTKLKESFPNSIVSDEGYSIDKHTKSKVDLVVFIVKSISHSEYFRIKDKCNIFNIPLVHCNHVNINQIISNIYNLLY